MHHCAFNVNNFILCQTLSINRKRESEIRTNVFKTDCNGKGVNALVDTENKQKNAQY